MVFAYDSYYPSGGTDDIVGRFETEADARKCAEEHKRFDFVEILDVVTGKDIHIPKIVDMTASQQGPFRIASFDDK